MIALISSVPEEGGLLRKEIKDLCKSRVTSRELLTGKIHNKNIVYTISGMGKANAAHAATILLEKFSPEIAILFGVGGAYPSTGLKVGDIAVAEKEVYGDEGVLVKDGFKGTKFIGIPLLKKARKEYFNDFPLDKKLADKAVQSSELVTRHSSHVTGVKSGVFVTLSACTGTRKRAVELKKRFSAICENMEGASAAHICTLYGIPMVEIRGISNIVEDRDKRKWDIRLAAENCQKAVMEFMKQL